MPKATFFELGVFLTVHGQMWNEIFRPILRGFELERQKYRASEVNGDLVQTAISIIIFPFKGCSVREYSQFIVRIKEINLGKKILPGEAK